jgi:hypothetical protein
MGRFFYFNSARANRNAKNINRKIINVDLRPPAAVCILMCLSRREQQVRATLSILFVPFFLSFPCAAAFSQDQPGQSLVPVEWVRMISPAENAEVLGKRPEMKAEFIRPVSRDKLLVTLDGTDVTQLASVTEGGFVFRPALPLAPGPHTLALKAVDTNGAEVSKTSTFTSRHSAILEEASSSNDLSVIYSQDLARHDSTTQSNPPQPGQPPTTVSGFSSKVESNLKTDNKVRRGPWEFTLSGNARYFAQNAPAPSPLEKGIDVTNWLMTGSYTKDALKVMASVGDVNVNETQNTISLNRKGGLLQIDYDIFQFRFFNLMTQQTVGIDGGAGFGGSTVDHILGGSARVKLSNKRLEFKTIYLSGGGSDSSPAISSAVAGGKQGQLLGFVLNSDFFQNMLKSEFETDFSWFNPDTSGGVGKSSDAAYLARISGTLGPYNYDGKYEYFGTDFGTNGNLGTLKDKEGVNVSQGLNLGQHFFLVNFSRYNDNVSGDDRFAQVVNYAGGINYTCNMVQNMPIGLGYQKALQASRREPVGAPQIDTMTDSVSANLSYTLNKLLLALSAQYSVINDRTDANADTITRTISFSPSYNLPALSLSPTFSWNATKAPTGFWTDSYTAGLNMFAKFFSDKLSFDTGSTYTLMKAGDNSVDTRQINVTANLSYSMKQLFKEIVNPALTLRSSYVNTTDKVNQFAGGDNFGLYLVLTVDAPFSL